MNTEIKAAVGDSVAVLFATEQDANENVRMVRAIPRIQTVEAVYLDGKIRTNTGDVWSVAPDPKNRAKFVSLPV